MPDECAWMSSAKGFAMRLSVSAEAGSWPANMSGDRAIIQIVACSRAVGVPCQGESTPRSIMSRSAQVFFTP